ncbi:MAG: AAA family ATPase [Candidatus Nanoarchaeia archaeon]|nr:AAA family ATPase [Candidatus Nanoarchaeia archaeon]
MSYFIIIRGPLGIGKSTIAKALAKKLSAEYISMDQILKENGLDVRGNEPCIPARNFIKANEIVLSKVKRDLKDKIVIFDGCFYHKEQIKHLEVYLPFEHYEFNLKAPIEVCIARDSKRKQSYGEGAARAVYSLVTKFDHGINIDTENKTKNQVVKEILSHLPPRFNLRVVKTL